MLHALKRLSLGLFLLVAASAVLLVSDVQRRASGSNQVKRIAIFQHASTPTLEEGVQGMLDGLAEKGYVDGQGIEIRRYNAEGDVATANAIARQITGGEYDLVLTSSTPSMQAVANANRDGRVNHVFTLVADPAGSGVGVSRTDPYDHPKHMVGYGIALPVREAFHLVKAMYPALRQVGVVWNTGEYNSQFFVGKAREACAELKLELVEGQVENTSGVVEALSSVIGRGAQCIWIGGDNTVNAAADTVVQQARRAGIPVFSIMPGNPDRGTLFDMGVDYHMAGKLSGYLAAEILGGADPAKMAVRDVVDLVPKRLLINKRTLAKLREPWRVPEDVQRKADTIVDETGVHRK